MSVIVAKFSVPGGTTREQLLDAARRARAADSRIVRVDFGKPTGYLPKGGGIDDAILQVEARAETSLPMPPEIVSPKIAAAIGGATNGGVGFLAHYLEDVGQAATDVAVEVVDTVADTVDATADRVTDRVGQSIFSNPLFWVGVGLAAVLIFRGSRAVSPV